MVRHHYHSLRCHQHQWHSQHLLFMEWAWVLWTECSRLTCAHHITTWLMEWVQVVLTIRQVQEATHQIIILRVVADMGHQTLQVTHLHRLTIGHWKMKRIKKRMTFDSFIHSITALFEFKILFIYLVFSL